jgi:hypothetical protein
VRTGIIMLDIVVRTGIIMLDIVVRTGIIMHTCNFRRAHIATSVVSECSWKVNQVEWLLESTLFNDAVSLLSFERRLR